MAREKGSRVKKPNTVAGQAHIQTGDGDEKDAGQEEVHQDPQSEQREKPETDTWMDECANQRR